MAAPCLHCQRVVTYKSGIICANFGVTRGRFHKCDSAYCAGCFVPSPLDPRVVRLPKGFDGADVEEVESTERFMVARPGDHACTSFQCPSCQSQNIRGRDLQPNIMADACFEALCIRATLDAFWSRSENTIKGHPQEINFMIRYGSALGFMPMPPLGPFRLGDYNGLLQALLLEMRLLQPGRRGPTAMFGTARMI